MKKILYVIIFSIAIVSMGFNPSYSQISLCYNAPWAWPYWDSNEYYIYPEQKIAVHQIDDYIAIVGILQPFNDTDSLMFIPTATIRRGLLPFSENPLSEDTVIYTILVANQPKLRLETMPRKIRMTDKGLKVVNELNHEFIGIFDLFFRPGTTEEYRKNATLSHYSQINQLLRVPPEDSVALVSPMDTVLGPEPSRLALYRNRKLGVYMPHERGAVVGTLHFREEGDTITFVPRVYVDTLLRTHLCDSLAPTADIARRRIILTADSMEVIPDIGRRRIYRR